VLKEEKIEEKRKRIDLLLNRKRKKTVEQVSEPAEKEKKEEENEDTKRRREEAKKKILWETQRAKERAEKMGPQGWVRPSSLNTNKQFLSRTIQSTLSRLEKRERDDKSHNRSIIMVVLTKTMLAPHSLSKEQVGRYSRQLLVADFGVNGQTRLSSSSVLIVGAGGLGCPCATYLAAAGVGTIGIIDFDTVSLDNLHRQVGHKEKNVGKKKTESLRDSLHDLNSSIVIKCHPVVLDRHNALEIFKGYEVIVDCSDNPATRYLINDACVLLHKPLVSGSALRWEGQLTVYNYGERCPCYRCVFPVPPSPNLVTNCAEGGVLGPIVGTIGSLQALEVLKIIGQTGTPYAGRLLLFDGQSGKMTTVSLRERSPKCAICSSHPTVTELIDYQLFCGSGVHDKIPDLKVLSPSERVGVAEYALIRKSRGVCSSIDDEDAVKLTEEGDNPSPSLLSIPLCQSKIRLFDTRPPNEFAIASLPEATNVPLDRLKNMNMRDLVRTLNLPKKNEEDKDVFFICHRGNDSQLAVRIVCDRLEKEKSNLPLEMERESIRIRDVVGGYQAWAEIVDDRFPVY
ncbi:hypothetical protein PFISCL1PPCAC_15358, partial [Pristionchus fissidentatus]